MLRLRNYYNKIHRFGNMYIVNSKRKNNLNLLFFNNLDKVHFHVFQLELFNMKY